MNGHLRIKKCYNCGVVLNAENKTKEHVPAQNLFLGCGHEYKKNRLTVPACKKCNEEYSEIDSEFRDVLGVANNKIDKDSVLTHKATRSILRKPNWKERLIANDANLIGVLFDNNKFEKLYIKNFKGIYYEELGQPFSNEYQTYVFSSLDNDHLNPETRLLIQLGFGVEWKISGHAEIFRYKISALNLDKADRVFLSNNFKSALGVWSLIEIHQRIMCVVIATRNKI